MADYQLTERKWRVMQSQGVSSRTDVLCSQYMDLDEEVLFSSGLCQNLPVLATWTFVQKIHTARMISSSSSPAFQEVSNPAIWC
jgi:hypothetical protein